MLGKLIKHEFKATYRSYLLLFALLLFLTILSKITLRVDTDFVFYIIFSRLFLIFDIVLMVSVSFIGTFLVIMRINRNLLRDEGYLSHTLPVKTWQHIIAKGITGTVWLLLCYIVLAVSIALYVGHFKTIWKVTREMFDVVTEKPERIGMLILVVIIVIAGVMVQVNSYMAALSLGQIFSKHKILGAAFFWCVMQFVLSMTISFLTEVIGRPYMDKLNNIDFGDGSGPVYIGLVTVLVIEIIVGTIYFFISNYMFSKKLNLE